MYYYDYKRHNALLYHGRLFKIKRDIYKSSAALYCVFHSYHASSAWS